MNPLSRFLSARTLLRGALVGALALSLRAALGPSCLSCQGAQGLLPLGKALPALGVLWYSTLLGLSLFGKGTRLLPAGLLLAAGTHAGLLALLVQAGVRCPVCFGTAGFALLALLAGLRLYPGLAFRASLGVPLLALLVQGASIGTRAGEGVQSARQDFVADLEDAPRAGSGLRLLAYTRPDCAYCIELEREVLPILERRFGAGLGIDLRSAQDLPGLPTPTLILSGPRGRRVFPGLPPTGRLIDTLEHLGGDGHDTALSQESR